MFIEYHPILRWSNQSSPVPSRGPGDLGPPWESQAANCRPLSGNRPAARCRRSLFDPVRPPGDQAVAAGESRSQPASAPGRDVVERTARATAWAGFRATDHGVNPPVVREDPVTASMFLLGKTARPSAERDGKWKKADPEQPMVTFGPDSALPKPWVMIRQKARGTIVYETRERQLQNSIVTPYRLRLVLKIEGFVMKVLGRSQLVLVASLLIAAPAFAQSTQGQTQPTQGGSSPASIGSGTTTKQKTQSMAHAAPTGAYKQKTQGDLPEVGPASGAYKGNVPHSQY
jgi:hypothetical protein